ncbi:DegT/DnrJ/EryC1/StrS family aminotransferase [Saccharospirillum impatiens]|uniref:DegT/DnrJ/EryC1/StrS family aminotransferase n=1 Tax=Saccharospirillum impatiens TaxID=169438 RepID=UPI0004919F49|nr:DegT/DnrJ/EryC1/StrS family aminotransferase [Saccharospirillum impatiens]
MSWAVYPPAGNAVDLQSSAFDFSSVFPDHQLIWLQSGTAALAWCLCQHRLLHPHVENPEVLIPAYGCPDLVAAADYAGYTPRLVDLADGTSEYDAAALAGAVTEHTLAVLAVNFLGLAANVNAIRGLLPEVSPIAIIEDNAQWFPEPDRPVTNEADYLTFSFGRGKAIGLLGGGLVATRVQPQPMDITPPETDRLWPVKARAYNALLHPLMYGVVSRLPGLSLGQTSYHALTGLVGMDPQPRAVLGANIERYQRFDPWRERCFDEALAGITSVQVPGLTTQGRRTANRGRLLRYPVLLSNREQRDAVLASLSQAGLGATAMYRHALPDIAGLEGRFDRTRVPNARQFADRLITLPVHEGIDRAAVARITDAVARQLN